MSEATFAQWNEFLRKHPDAHFLQTAEWGELKSRFGWEPIRLITGGSGVQVLFRRLPLGFTIAYIPKATAAQIAPADTAGLWTEVDALCRRKRAILCKHEPDAWEAAEETGELGEDWTTPAVRAIVPSSHNVQPRRTITVDLRPAEDVILGRMKQKCRYNIRLAEKKGVTVRAWADTTAFHAMLIITGKRDEFAVHSTAYYQRAYDLFRQAGMCELLVAEFEDRPLAALMVFARGRRAWYLYGGSTDAERERMPNHLLQWEAMRWARDHGCEEYDLWGVPDEEHEALEAGFAQLHEGLWGVYRFKRGFGGELRRAVQAVDRVYSPLLYQAYLLRTSGREAQ